MKIFLSVVDTLLVYWCYWCLWIFLVSDDEEQRRAKEILTMTSVTSDKVVSHPCGNKFLRVPIAEAESDSDSDDSSASGDDDKYSQVNMIF